MSSGGPETAASERGEPTGAEAVRPSKSPWKILISAAVTATLLAVLFWKVDFGAMVEALRLGDVRLIALALLLGLAVHIFMGADIWRRILLALGHRLPYRDALFARVGSDPIRFILPFKLGEISKPLYLKRRLGVPLDRGIGSVVFEKFLNLLGLFILFLASYAFQSYHPVGGAAVAGLIAGLLALESARVRKFVFHVADSLHPKLHRLASQLLAVFAEAPLRKKAFLWAYAVLYQFRQILCCWLLLAALGVEVPPFELAVRASAAFFLASIPVTIGGIGLREAAIVTLFAPYAAPGKLLAVGLLMSATVYILPSLVGLALVHRFVVYVAEEK